MKWEINSLQSQIRDHDPKRNKRKSMWLLFPQFYNINIKSIDMQLNFPEAWTADLLKLHHFIPLILSFDCQSYSGIIGQELKTLLYIYMLFEFGSKGETDITKLLKSLRIDDVCFSICHEVWLLNRHKFQRHRVIFDLYAFKIQNEEEKKYFVFC